MDSLSQTDNRTLAQQCLLGDSEALSLFYTRFSPRMLSLIRRFVPELADAEDILHDGFIIAFTRLNSLHDYERVESWLATIMRNLSIRFLQEQDVNKILHVIPDIANTPEAEQFIDFEALEKLLTKLPNGYQNVFRLAVLENKSHKEIGKMLGIAPKTSSSQLFHAKVMMRKLIADYRLQNDLCVLLGAAGLFWFLKYDYRLAADEDSEHQREYVYSHKSSAERNQYVNDVTDQEAIDKKVIQCEGTVPKSSQSELANITPQEDINKVSYPPLVQLINEYSLQSSIAPQVILIQPDSISSFKSRPLDEHEEKINKGISVLPVVDNKKKWEMSSSFATGIDQNNTSTGPMDASGDANPGQEDSTEEVSQVLPSQSGSGIYKDWNARHYMPFTFGVSVAKRFSKHLGAEGGLTYTYLHSRFERGASQTHCQWHYMGIKFKLLGEIYRMRDIRIYGTTGIDFNIPLVSTASVETGVGLSVPPPYSGRFHSPVVWTLTAGCGVAYRISSGLELYVEPSAQYHFPKSYNVPNIWTKARWGFTLPIGFRIQW